MASGFHARFKDRASFLGKQGEFQFTHSIPISKQTPPSDIPSAPSQFPLPRSRNSPSLPHFPTKDSSDYLFARPIKLPAPNQSLPAPNPSHRSSARNVSVSRIEPVPEGRLTKPTATTISRKPTLAKSQSHFKSLSADQSLQPSPQPSDKKQRSGYLPYTLRDYQLTKLPENLILGGLGSTAGSIEWVKKKEMSDKKKGYGRRVFVENANRLAFALAKPKQSGAIVTAVNSRTRALEFARTIKVPGCRSDQGFLSVAGRRPDSSEPAALRSLIEELKARLLA